jgi:hypothetical protein
MFRVLTDYDLCNVVLQMTSAGQARVVPSMVEKGSLAILEENDCALMIGAPQSPISQVFIITNSGGNCQ